MESPLRLKCYILPADIIVIGSSSHKLAPLGTSGKVLSSIPMNDESFPGGEGSLLFLNMTLLERALPSDRIIRLRCGRKPSFVTRILEQDYLNMNSYILMGRNSSV